jgi:hypothetical protein
MEPNPKISPQSAMMEATTKASGYDFEKRD